MPWFDYSLKSGLATTLETADVVKEKPKTKQEREFKSKLLDDLISDIARKYIPYTVQAHLKEVAKKAYNIDHLFSVDYDIDTRVITITHHWQSAKQQDAQFVYLEQQTEVDLEVDSIERFLNSLVAKQYNPEYNSIVDSWLKRPVQLPHGEVFTTVASQYLVINLKPKNPEK